VGVCVAATLPFFVRDLGQLGKTPPILSESLPVFSPSRGQFRFPRPAKGEVRLTEVRAVVEGGTVAWSPFANTLPELAPTEQSYSQDALDLPSLPTDQTLYRFSMRWGGDREDVIDAALRTQPGADGEKYRRTGLFAGNFHGSQERRVWRTAPKGTRTADVYAGLAFASDTRTLAQFPVLGSLGVSYGAKAVWGTSQDSYLTPVEITLPANLRPQQAGTYFLRSYTINRWGMPTLADTRAVDISPKTTTIHLPLSRFPDSRDARAVRVTITPYRWARYADVPLMIPDGNVARLSAIPITPAMEQKRRAIARGGAGAIGDYQEFFRIRHDALTHPQLARFVPGAVTLTHTHHYLNSPITGGSPQETRFYAFVPDGWHGIDVDQDVTLYAITKSGKRVRMTPDGFTSEEGGGMRVDFRLPDIAYEDVAEVSFGLTR
jgi:hypothetical protein